MSRLRYNRAAAVAHLRSACSSMDRYIQGRGAFRLQVARGQDLFEALSKAIVYQQLSGKAAATIFGRFARLFDGTTPKPAELVDIPFETLRGAGLSNNKALAVRDLAEKVLSGSLASPRRMARMDDGAVIENLCQVRGIGPWTAQMYLIFNLGRPDVMPSTDLGIQKGVQYVYGCDSLPSPQEVLDLTDHLAPYRSAASWYLWLAADTGLIN